MLEHIDGVRLASPDAIVDVLAKAFPRLNEFARILSQTPSSLDIERETSRQTDAWNNYVNPPPGSVAQSRPPGTSEFTLKVGVRTPLVALWFDRPLHSA